MTIAAYHRQTGAHVTRRARSPPGNHFFPSNQNQWSSGEGLTEFDMMTVQWAVGRLTSQSRGSITESNFLFTLWLPSHHLESHMTGLCLNDRWHQWNSLNVFAEFNMNPDSAGEVSSPCAGGSVPTWVCSSPLSCLTLPAILSKYKPSKKLKMISMSEFNHFYIGFLILYLTSNFLLYLSSSF